MPTFKLNPITGDLDLVKSVDEINAIGDARYLKLDCSNDPLTSDLSTNENIELLDNKKLYFGDNNASSISFDGTSLNIDNNESEGVVINDIYFGPYASGGYPFISRYADRNGYKGIKLEENKTQFGTGGSFSFIVVGGVMEMKRYDIDCAVDFRMIHDNSEITFGAGDDASITYDGTDLCINTAEVGSGTIKINGTAAWSGTFTNGDGATVTVTDGLITGVV